MAKKQHYTREVASRLRTEMLTNARAAAKTLEMPDDAADGQTMTGAQFIALSREQAAITPAYGNLVLDRMAPACIPAEKGEMLRSEVGLENYIDWVRDCFPEVYVQVMIAEPS